MSEWLSVGELLDELSAAYGRGDVARVYEIEQILDARS
tara:strand:- start:374 stop:487 length:114 start_codon:yes stop_codon:yes gene_type:complete